MIKIMLPFFADKSVKGTNPGTVTHYRAFKGLAQAANSTVFQEMAPLFLCTYSTMEGSPLHMTSPMKVALKI